jgi:hypothetical protein
MMQLMHVNESYTPRITRSRELMTESNVLKAMLEDDVNPVVLERFLIEYCSLGVQITEPVEAWIDRAGQRCIETGLADIGKSLRDHAHHEAGHHLMFMEDTRRLVAEWNARHPWSLDAEQLFARPATRAMKHYIALHEETIAGSLPFGQVAIELEIERLSVVLVPRLLAQVERVLGAKVAGLLSFLSSHGELDIGHTHMNTRMMDSLLNLRPEAAGDLARTGAEALWIYISFFGECWSAATHECRLHLSS